MTSRAGALIAPSSWGRVRHPEPAEASSTRQAARDRTLVSWGIRANVRTDVAGAAAMLAATAGLWTAFFVAVW